MGEDFVDFSCRWRRKGRIKKKEKNNNNNAPWSTNTTSNKAKHAKINKINTLF